MDVWHGVATKELPKQQFQPSNGIFPLAIALLHRRTSAGVYTVYSGLLYCFF